jgi:hypothetical protein
MCVNHTHGFDEEGGCETLPTLGRPTMATLDMESALRSTSPTSPGWSIVVLEAHQRRGIVRTGARHILIAESSGCHACHHDCGGPVHRQGVSNI